MPTSDNSYIETSPTRGRRRGALDFFNSDPKYGQFLRFCVNGVLAVAIQYAVYWVLIKWINVNIAYTLSYIVSFCCNFVITSVNFFVQLGFLNLYLWLGIPKEWAALLAMGSAVPVNFAMLHFVYKKRA